MKAMEQAEDAIVQEIAIKGSAERIFDALTRPEELLKWWGVAGKWQLDDAEADLRPGGVWRFTASSADGTQTIFGTYREIDRPHLLVYTWLRGGEETAETVVRWELEERSGVTQVRVTHSGLVSESLRTRNNGWPVVVVLLQTYVEGRNGQ